MGRIRVLIVDDVAQVRHDLRMVLSLAGDATGCGIEVIGEAANGREAIQQVQALQPDVVLMDLEMPVLDGYAATRQIKARYPAVRVVALTVYSHPASQAQARQAGADAFLEKGIAVNEIIRALQPCSGGEG